MKTREPTNFFSTEHQSNNLPSLSLERIIFLKFLYPKELIDFMETEQVIGYTKDGIKVIQDDSHMTSKRFNDQLSELNKEISFCPFLIGYSQRLASAFRHTPWVQKILKETNSYIISSSKYNKLKKALFEKHKELKSMKEEHMLFQDTQLSCILVTLSVDVESVKEQLLTEQGSIFQRESISSSNIMKKFRLEFSLKQIFEEEPKISLQLLKNICNRYEKKVSILYRIEPFKGKYRLSFGLTTFADPFLLEIVGKDLEDQFQDRRDIMLNHFEITYYRKVLWFHLKKLPAFSQISLSIVTYEIDRSQLFYDDCIVCNMTLQGRRIAVTRAFDELKPLLNKMRTKKIEIPVSISKIVYDEFFKKTISNWLNSFEQKYQDIVVSYCNFTFVNESRKEGNKNKSQNLLVIYVIGPEGKFAQIEKMGEDIYSFLSSLRHEFYNRSLQELTDLSCTYGYPNIGQLAEGFELVLKEAFKKEQFADSTLVYGRKEDINAFKNFMRNNGTIENIEVVIEYLKALQNKSDDLSAMAGQHQVEYKIHPYLPRIYFSGNKNAVETFKKLFKERISQLKKETKFYPIESNILFWLQNPLNKQNIERKYKVFLIRDENSETTDAPMIGILNSKGQHLSVLEDLKIFALGNIVEREIQLFDLNSLKECLIMAEKQGFEAKIIDNFLVVKGYQNKVQEFKENILRDQRKEVKNSYPHKYWDTKINDQIMIIDVNETSPEYKSMSSLFNRTMEKSKIRKIQRIQNNYLLDRFKATERLLSGTDMSLISLFYGSKNVDPAQIYEDFELGFDCNFSNSEDHKGFYFTLDAAIAHENYGYRVDKNIYQMLVTDVIAEKGSLCTSQEKRNQYFIDNSSKCYPLYLIEYEQRD